jgi:RNA polymerase sigma-70 factor (ECF subfamily)
LLDHATPETYALAALMHLGAARLSSRIDDSGNLTLLFDQDRSRWNPELIAEGMRLLEASAKGDELTAYHVEAGIAGLHASASSIEETPWGKIVQLYDTLMKIHPSPVVALNRAIAIAEHEGPARGLEAIREIDAERFASWPFYEAALGELERRSGRVQSALEHFRVARIAECEPS